jgi:glycosyl transferase family 25
VQIFVINLSNAIERRKFQQSQLSKLGLQYKIINATSVDDITESTYKKHYNDWQRPLLNTEGACYFSHRSAWYKIIKINEPALILEDDALLSICVPKILNHLEDNSNIDLVNLENRGRKKFVSKSKKNIECNSKLIRLYQDRTGAAGYILWPSGAKKLIQLEQASGIGLADAHITSCHSLKAYQVEPSPVIQMDQCINYGIENIYIDKLSTSTVSSHNKSTGGIRFIINRSLNQFKLGLRQLSLVTKSERRYIKIKIKDFYL